MVIGPTIAMMHNGYRSNNGNDLQQLGLFGHPILTMMHTVRFCHRLHVLALMLLSYM